MLALNAMIVICLNAWFECIVCECCDCNCVFTFPQRVDKTLDVAGEDSSQAKDVVPRDFADEGKPPSKTQTPHYPFYFPFVSFILYHDITFLWLGLY